MASTESSPKEPSDPSESVGDLEPRGGADDAVRSKAERGPVRGTETFTGRVGLAVGVAALVLLFSWFVREANQMRMPAPGSSTEAGEEADSEKESADWYSWDPDGMYHMRRLQRWFEEGTVAGFDPRLNHPEGSAIPWPPYYTYVLGALLSPGAPDPAREPEALRAHIEEGVASWPVRFAILGALVAAWIAWRWAGPFAALLAGLNLPLVHGALHYGIAGNGDHHAFVTLLTLAMMACVTEACIDRRLESPRAGLAWGVAAGGIAGLLIGSWAGGLMYVLLVQGALAFLIFRHTRRPLPALASFGLAYHLTAAAVLAPAVLSSPWIESSPWMVVNLSYFHGLHLLLGAAVFVPMPFLKRESAIARHYPWCVGGALGALYALAFAFDVGPAQGIREGFAWAGRTNDFMAYILESQPLVGNGKGLASLTRALGWGALLAPVAWVAAVWISRRERSWARLPLLVAIPVLFQQALVQQRFAELLAGPLSVLLAFGVVTACRAVAPRLPASLRNLPKPLLALGALLLCALSNPATAWPLAKRGFGGGRLFSETRGGPATYLQGAQRKLYERLRALPRDEAAPGVLAGWEHGHGIEWGADRPSVGTNFGIYVGEDSYLDPWRFFLMEDPAEAEAILERRRCRYVMITSRHPRLLPTALRILQPGTLADYIARDSATTGTTRGRFYRSLGGRLLLHGYELDTSTGQPRGDSLDFLRLVHISAERISDFEIRYMPGPLPLGYLWEHVPGARVEVAGTAGEEVELALDLDCDHDDVSYSLRWIRHATVEDDGFARIRIPYATDAPNGDLRSLGRARWKHASGSGTLEVPESAVLTGAKIRIED